ncbi:MAG: zinc-binding dehydrogenase, partial [Bacteroidota bacterium]
KHFGARVIATTRTPEKKSFLLEHGADHVIVTQEENLAEEVNKLTEGKGFHIAFDPIDGQVLGNIAEAAAQEASIILYGALSNQLDTPLPLLPTLVKGLKFHGVHLVFHMLRHDRRFAKAKEHLLDGLQNGIYKPVIDCIFSLDQVKVAYQYKQSSHQRGKILIVN